MDSFWIVFLQSLGVTFQQIGLTKLHERRSVNAQNLDDTSQENAVIWIYT